MFGALIDFLAGLIRLPRRGEFGCLMAMIVLAIAGIWVAIWTSP